LKCPIQGEDIGSEIEMDAQKEREEKEQGKIEFFIPGHKCNEAKAINCEGFQTPSG
jgi:hypothetical protein